MAQFAPPPDSDDPPLTEMLHRAAAGEAAAAESVMPLVYRELHRLARARMLGERGDHTLQATALVHEAWLKLVGLTDQRWADRGAFYDAAATAMRRILVDHARRRTRTKRGGGVRHDHLAIAEVAARQPDVGDPATFLQLDELIERLAAEDPRAGVVRLRFFAGLGIDETAAALGVSRRSMMREWAYARARLLAALEDE